jgi:hypothetical protein
MIKKIATVASAIMAVLCGYVAIAVFSSGSSGYERFIGLVFGFGAVAFGLLAAKIRYTASAPSQHILESVSLSSGQRLGCIAMGLLVAGFTLHHLSAGYIDIGRGGATYRANDPFNYWLFILLSLGMAAMLLYLGMRKPPSQ